MALFAVVAVEMECGCSTIGSGNIEGEVEACVLLVLVSSAKSAGSLLFRCVTRNALSAGPPAPPAGDESEPTVTDGDAFESV